MKDICQTSPTTHFSATLPNAVRCYDVKGRALADIPRESADKLYSMLVATAASTGSPRTPSATALLLSAAVLRYDAAMPCTVPGHKQGDALPQLWQEATFR